MNRFLDRHGFITLTGVSDNESYDCTRLNVTGQDPVLPTEN